MDIEELYGHIHIYSMVMLIKYITSIIPEGKHCSVAGIEYG